MATIESFVNDTTRTLLASIPTAKQVKTHIISRILNKMLDDFKSYCHAVSTSEFESFSTTTESPEARDQFVKIISEKGYHIVCKPIQSVRNEAGYNIVVTLEDAYEGQEKSH